MRTHWLIVKTKAGRERYAARNVLRCASTLAVWLPVLDGLKGKEEIVFPGFLFVKTHGAWHYLESCYGCTKVLTFGDKPGILPHRVIRAMRAEYKKENEARRPKYRYEQGEAVTIVAGPYAGISGMYRNTTPEKRICIMLSFMGRMVPVEQRAEHVRATASLHAAA